VKKEIRGGNQYREGKSEKEKEKEKEKETEGETDTAKNQRERKRQKEKERKRERGTDISRARLHRDYIVCAHATRMRERLRASDKTKT